MRKKSVKLTGLLYLLVIVCAGFSQGYVRANLFVLDDAAATATNILDNEGLFRMGMVSDLIAFILDAVISILFYKMLKPFGKTLALVSASMRLLAHPAIGTLNLLNHFMALHVLTGASVLIGFDPAQLESFSLLFMEAHRYGYMIAGGFFGVHCFLLGILLYRSKMIPRFFALLMMVAAIGYLMETFGNFLFPGNESWLAWVVGLTAALGEVLLALFMLIKGTVNSYSENLKAT
ncbi:MAG: DUF4386 domain-containing protein [Bacteroidetes bacterium]|nr:DUF4386 domain-containing protein [Bacteroidota bacterium]